MLWFTRSELGTENGMGIGWHKYGYAMAMGMAIGMGDLMRPWPHSGSKSLPDRRFPHCTTIGVSCHN